MSNYKLKIVKSATALVLGASVLTTAVVVPGADASAKTTYKVTKSGTLVDAKTNKAVKGYKSYKGKLYKNGKILTGLYNNKYYYKNGVKATGTYAGAFYYKGSKKVTTGTYNNAYYYKGVKKVATGVYNNYFYLKGVKKVGTGVYNNYFYLKGVKKVGTGVYNNAFYLKGVKKVATGTYNGAFYLKGVKKITTGTYNGAYYDKGVKKVTTGLYESKFYKDGVLNVGLALYDGKYYFDTTLADGVYEDANGVKKLYKDGSVVDLAAKSASAINANQISVTFNNGETVTVDLTEALADGATTVSFEYNDQKFTDVALDAAYEAPDKDAPVLKVNGETTVNVENGAELTLPEVMATDNKDKSVEPTKVITNSQGKELDSIDTKVADTYTVTYSAKDAAGNNADPVVVTVVVAEAPLKVVEVSAITNTTATVTLDKKPAEDPTNQDFEVTVGGEKVAVTVAKDASDLEGKTYKLTFASLKLNKGTLSVNGTEAAFDFTTPVESVSAINETSVKVTVPTTVKEEELAGKQVTLTSGNTEVKATYLADSLTTKGEATFKLDGDAKLVDAKSYVTTADWATIINGDFVAKVATAYVAAFDKVTTGITAKTYVAPVEASGDVEAVEEDGVTTINVAAKNQYGEEIAAPASATLKATLNGMPLSADEASYANGVVKIKKSLKETDEVSINLVTTKTVDEKTVEVANSTLAYTVLKEEAVKISSITLNAAKTSLPAKEASDLTVKVLDQFNNETVDASGLRFVVNGSVVTPEDDSDLIQLNDGKYTFKTSTPGEYKVEVYSTTDSKVKASSTIVVGAATLTGLTVTQPDEVVTASNARFNKEDMIVATVAPNEGAALTPENLKFNVTTTTTGLSAADVNVVAEKKTVGTGAEATEVIVIKANTSKPGTFTVTPYVGESFTSEGVKLGDSVTFTTNVNPTVASISDFAFDTKALKAGATNVQAEVVFKNKHNEVLTANQVATNNVEAYTSSNTGITGSVTVAQGTGDNAGKTYVNLAKLVAGTALVTVQVGEELKSTQVKVVTPTLTTINAGADISGVVAGDSSDESFAKYNEVKFLDQDDVSLSETAATLKVRKSGATADLTDEEAAKLVTLGTAVKDDQGTITGLANSTTNINAIKVHPEADVAEGTYTVTVSKVVGEGTNAKTVSDSFTVTVGAARALSTVDLTNTVSTLSVGGTTKVLVTPKDQYGNVVELPSTTTQGVTTTTAIELTPNTVVSASAFTAKKDKDGKLLGYETTLTGDAKGTVNAEFAVTTGSGDTAVTKKATKSFVVDAVGNLAASVDVTNPGLLQASDLTKGKQLEAVVKDVNGTVVNTATEDLTWEASKIVAKNAAGEVVPLEAGEVEVSETGSLTVNLTTEGVKTITLEATAQTANLKTGSTTVEISTDEPNLVGDLAVVSTVADKVLDADAAKAGIQISLDGDDKDGELLDTEAAGTISVQLEGNDQYGNEDVNFDESDAKLSTNDKTIATIGLNDGNDAIVISPKSVGTTQVHIQFGGKTVTLDVTVTENNAAIKAAVADAKATTDANAFKTAHETVLAKTVDNIAISDKEAVQAAQADFTALSDEAEAKLVDGEGTLLTDLAAKITDLEAQKAVDDEAAKITTDAIGALVTGDNVVTEAQALVADGSYVVSIVSSANAAIDGTTGTVTQQSAESTGNVVLKVTKGGKEKDVTVALTVAVAE